MFVWRGEDEHCSTTQSGRLSLWHVPQMRWWALFGGSLWD